MSIKNKKSLVYELNDKIGLSDSNDKLTDSKIIYLLSKDGKLYKQPYEDSSTSDGEQILSLDPDGIPVTSLNANGGLNVKITSTSDEFLTEQVKSVTKLDEKEINWLIHYTNPLTDTSYLGSAYFSTCASDCNSIFELSFNTSDFYQLLSLKSEIKHPEISSEATVTIGNSSTRIEFDNSEIKLKIPSRIYGQLNIESNNSNPFSILNGSSNSFKIINPYDSVATTSKMQLFIHTGYDNSTFSIDFLSKTIEGSTEYEIASIESKVYDDKGQLKIKIFDTGTPGIDPMTDIIEITSNKTKVNNSLESTSIGYSDGSGGSVTQSTSKSTAVTLNKMSGQITTHNAEMSAGEVVTFELNNSLLQEKHTMRINPCGSGSTIGAYRIHPPHITDGVAYITIENRSGGSLSEALKLNFDIFKSSIS